MWQDSKSFPKARRKATTDLWHQLCDEEGFLYLEKLEDYLMEEYPDVNPHFLIKLLDESARARLYSDEPIEKEVREH